MIVKTKNTSTRESIAGSAIEKPYVRTMPDGEYEDCQRVGVLSTLIMNRLSIPPQLTARLGIPLADKNGTTPHPISSHGTGGVVPLSHPERANDPTDLTDE